LGTRRIEENDRGGNAEEVGRANRRTDRDCLDGTSKK